jgi:ATP-dependent DNA helicase RecQ
MAILARGGYVERFDIPRKRMKGTRLLKPDVSSRGLQLDEAAIEEKDRRDREKLKAMVEMCYSRSCRQQWILNYFGEEEAGVCGTCDVCRDEGSGVSRPPTEEEMMIVRKTLSGVARMSRRTATGWEARYGRGRIIQMLAGSKSQEIIGGGLDKLTTYGILKDKGTGYLNSLMRSLTDAGLVITVTGEFPLLTLTARGDKVMRGASSFQLVWPDPEAGRKEVALKDHGFDGQLYSMLRDIREKIAKRDDVPSYVVFGNKTLEALARYQPINAEEALHVPGIGAAKVQRYAKPFLDAIVMWKKSRR